MLLVPILYRRIEFESKTLIEVYYMLRFRQWQMMANSTPYGWAAPWSPCHFCSILVTLVTFFRGGAGALVTFPFLLVLFRYFTGFVFKPLQL